MSKSLLIKKLKKKYPKIKKDLLEKIINQFFDSISIGLKSGNAVEIRGFMRFITKELKERHNAFNPSTQEKIYVPSKKVVRIKLTRSLFNAINENNEK